MRIDLIAPCGMNCELCRAYQREKKPCKGCKGDNTNKPASCLKCVIKNCSTIQNSTTGLCYECDKFPCPKLKQLDTRYRTKYHMSMIENLHNIEKDGMSTFLLNEKIRWTCKECGNIVCVHQHICLVCKRPIEK